MKIIFGYDIITYNGPLPNCLNPKFITTFYDGSKFDYGKSYHHFNKTWGCDYSVFNSNEFNEISRNKSIYDIVLDRENGENYKWFYIIEPHSGLDLFFGHHKVHNEFALNFISDKSINEIKNHNGNILINYTVDGGLGINEENLKMIINFTRKNEIPDEKVYFIFADYELKNNFTKLGANYNVYDYSFYLPFKSHEFNKLIKNNVGNVVLYEEYEDHMNYKTKDFLLLSRHWKQHRIFILNKLHRLGLDNSLVSWEKSYYNDRMIDELFKYDKNEDFAKLIRETSRYIDVEDLINVSGYGFENRDMYLKTYISLVTESIFFQSDINYPTGFISEKIWKPIGQCQPFILAGPANSLKYIKDRFGFKSFHPFIDESYDSVNNDMERLDMILVEIEKFSKKSKSDKIEFLNNVKDICFYNQKQFLQYSESKEEIEKVHTFLNQASAPKIL
jgi:hypothetical protein